MKNYQFLAQQAKALKDKSLKLTESERGEYMERILTAMKTFPHGSGFDGSSNLLFELSGANKIVIQFDYHPMDEQGGYREWITLRLVVTANLLHYSFDMALLKSYKIGSIWRKLHTANGLEDYLLDVLSDWLEDLVSLEARDLVKAQIASERGS